MQNMHELRGFQTAGNDPCWAMIGLLDQHRVIYISNVFF